MDHRRRPVARFLFPVSLLFLFSATRAWAQQPTEAVPSEQSKIERIQFSGNCKVEDDAMRVNLVSQVGGNLDQGNLRDDVRALWKMGFFEDVRVEAEVTDSG